MPDELTTDAHPEEYDREPVYNRVPSVEVIERMQRQRGLRPREALATEFTTAYRESLRI